MTSFFRQLLAAILSLAVCIPTYGFAVGNRKQITSTLAPVPRRPCVARGLEVSLRYILQNLLFQR